MNKFCSGQSANVVHHGLKSALFALEKAQKCAVLWFGEILDRKLYQELGYSSINQDAQTELGFSKSRTDDFISLCRKLDKMPLVKSKLESGDLGYTKARVLAPVIDQANEKGRVDFAVKNSRREVERAQGDCQVNRPGKRNTTSIPPATRRQVLAHHRHKCQRPGCNHTAYLEAHHIIPRSKGGSNNFGNLTCLCSVCHKLLHDKKISAADLVRSPRPVYRWYDSSLPVDLAG